MPTRISFFFLVAAISVGLTLVAPDVSQVYLGNLSGVALTHSIGFSAPTVYGFLPHIPDFPAADITSPSERKETNDSLARLLTRAYILQRTWDDLAALPSESIERDPLMQGDSFARMALESHVALARNQLDTAVDFAYLGILFSNGQANAVDYSNYYQLRILINALGNNSTDLYNTLRYAEQTQNHILKSDLLARFEQDQVLINSLDADRKAIVYYWLGQSTQSKGLEEKAKDYWWQALSERIDFAPAIVALSTLSLSSNELDRLCTIAVQARQNALLAGSIQPIPPAHSHSISFLDSSDFDEGLSGWVSVWKNNIGDQVGDDCINGLGSVSVLRERNLVPEGAFEWSDQQDTNTIELDRFWGKLYGEPNETRVRIRDGSQSFIRLRNNQISVRASLVSRNISVESGLCYLLTARLRSNNGGRGTIITRWFDKTGNELGRGSTIENMVDEDWRRVQSLSISPLNASYVVIWLLNYESLGAVDYDDVVFFTLGDNCQ